MPDLNDLARNSPAQGSLSTSLARAAYNALNSPFNSPSRNTGTRRTQVEACTESSKEVERQIARIRPYLKWAVESECEHIDKDGLNKGIALLRQLANGPTPIPMIAISEDGRASLHMEVGGHYLEANFSGDMVEYLFHSESLEQFFEEPFVKSEIPSNLLYLLYSHFARNSDHTVAA